VVVDLPADRYASLFFIAGIEMDDNELITLEIIHRYVEVLDRYFGNVCSCKVEELLTIRYVSWT